MPTPPEKEPSHWPEYLIEAAGLGVFMISACLFTALLYHPLSPVRQALPSALLRNALTGLAMGLTLIAIVYSPWGKRSGAHLNPAFTLTFLRLGKVAPRDAAFYVGAQFVGGLVGVMVSALLLGGLIRDPGVNFAVTVPGPAGPGAAFLAEAGISFLMMTMVLISTNTPGVARYTGLFAGALVATYITFESPISGMSMNPARTLASALPAWLFPSIWVYFTAPLLGMLLAAEIFVRFKGLRGVHCAKFHHDNTQRCIFRCRYGEMAARRDNPA
ncbi:MAG: aquaporin [Acidobacteria bacterium]|nr:aquaporin [Acidobacteriota bacterium]